MWLHFEELKSRFRLEKVVSGFKMDFRRDILNTKFDLSWIKVWSRVGFFSAMDSLIRNVVYLIVVLRAMNLLKEQVPNE